MRSLLATALLAVAVALAACTSDDVPLVTGDGTSTTGRGGTIGAPAPGGGLTVEEAIASDAGEPLTVAGYLFVRGGDAKLCDAMLESYPPQCGGPSLVVEGLDVEEVEGVRSEGGMAWTEERVSLLGEVVGGAIRVTSTSI